jgi:hypothetical protein
MQVKELIREYGKHLQQARGVSESTRHQYIHYVQCFLSETFIDLFPDKLRDLQPSELIQYVIKQREQNNHIIDFARTYSTSSKRVGISSYIERYTYEINIDCVEELSKINTPVSSNILHLLVKMKDVHGLPGEEEDGYSRLKSVSFQPIRKLARDELKKRGNPPYDSSAYLSEDGWTIKK